MHGVGYTPVLCGPKEYRNGAEAGKGLLQNRFKEVIEPDAFGEQYGSLPFYMTTTGNALQFKSGDRFLKTVSQLRQTDILLRFGDKQQIVSALKIRTDHGKLRKELSFLFPAILFGYRMDQRLHLAQLRRCFHLYLMVQAIGFPQTRFLLIGAILLLDQRMALIQGFIDIL